jgi:hypothetical protein
MSRPSSAQAQLATFKLNADQIQALTPRVLDLAEGMRKFGRDQVDAEQAGIILGKALRGNAGELSRYGITLTDAQRELVTFGTEQEKVAALGEAIDANYKGLSESLNPYEQALVRSKNGTGDFVEILGGIHHDFAGGLEGRSIRCDRRGGWARGDSIRDNGGHDRPAGHHGHGRADSRPLAAGARRPRSTPWRCRR